MDIKKTIIKSAEEIIKAGNREFTGYCKVKVEVPKLDEKGIAVLNEKGETVMIKKIRLHRVVVRTSTIHLEGVGQINDKIAKQKTVLKLLEQEKEGSAKAEKEDLAVLDFTKKPKKKEIQKI